MEKSKKIKSSKKKAIVKPVASKVKEIKVKLSTIADLIGGRLIGEDKVVKGLSSIDEQRVDTLSIMTVESMIRLADNGATAFLVTSEMQMDKPQIVVRDTRPALVKLMNIFYPKKTFKHSIAESAYVNPSAKLSLPVNIGQNVVVGDGTTVDSHTAIMHNCVIGDNVEIGSNCTIYPNVTIYDNCIIGDDVIIHAGAVIGADGFGFIQQGELPIKIPQNGKVVIGDSCEIGANSCIDRSTLGSTIIGTGTKLDDLVMVGHNTKIGKSCLIASQVGFAGSITTGDNIVAAGQVGFADHIHIASDTLFAGQAGVPNDIKEKGAYLGTPCMPFLKYAKSHAVFMELPELKKRVREIENKND